MSKFCQDYNLNMVFVFFFAINFIWPLKTSSPEFFPNKFIHQRCGWIRDINSKKSHRELDCRRFKVEQRCQQMKWNGGDKQYEKE